MFITYSMWTYLFAETSFRKCFDWFYIYNATYSVEVCSAFHLGKSSVFLQFFASNCCIQKNWIDGGIGIGITVFFRFIPEISIRMKEINNGMKIRGFKASIFKPIRTFELYFVPLMYKCIDISDTLTCSIISKGIEYDGKKTSFHEVKITFIDISMIVGGMILLGASLWKIFQRQK